MKPHWHLPAPDPAAVAALQRDLHCPHAIAQLWVARNLTDPQHFFNPSLDQLHSPNLLLGMAAAVSRIQRAVAACEPILIYGDYDVDGTTATVLLKTAIERTAPPDRPAIVTYHVPHRLREGYGIQNVRLAEAAAAGVRLVLSVDTGIRAFAAAAEAKALGLDLIVTDHHLPDGNHALPEALAVINPAQPGCPYPNKNLCGAGVAFKLAHALLAAHASTEPERQRLQTAILPSFLKLVAIATIADSVELTGENRTIVALGLRALASPIQPGLRALMHISKLALDKAPTATEVGFRLSPRINAAGRMDIASDVVELFLTRDRERAAFLAEKLDHLNQARRDTEASALLMIEAQLAALCDADGLYPPECIVLDDPAWHRGVVGILASRVVDRTHRPALIISTSNGDAHGSGRSVAGYHLVDALTHAHAADGPAPLFTRFGGHAHAVGFSLPTPRLADLRERIRSHSTTHLSASILAPVLHCDAELSLADISVDLYHWIARCEPFGMGHPEPVFLARALSLAAEPRTIKDRHLCLQLCPADRGKPLNAMGWTRAAQLSWPERARHLNLTEGSDVDLVFHLRWNDHPTYCGLELVLLDLTLSEPRGVLPASTTGREASAP